MSLLPSLGGKERDQPMPRTVRLSGAAGPMMLGSLHGPRGLSKSTRELSAEEQQELRRKINSRERKRMQDLNVAMDALREVMVPYSSSPTGSAASSVPGQQHPFLPTQGPGAPPTGRRLSKISTLVLARNYILLLASSLQEMRRLLGELSIGVGGANGSVPRLLLTGGWPFLSGPGQFLLSPESLLAPPSKCPLLPPVAPLAQEELPMWGGGSGGSGGVPGGIPGVCTCGVCRVPRVVHSSGPRFPK
ncbi:oligodendrocyte transcription factor 1 [Denticeps clupeoides]|uniref:oligodendrocyte transcription factor 1 n=1 Tax=Denticeps clupeoides TaxID=299321 RepID=UPI0010A3F9DF|nr:oligodendrocyte transcription factor 1 [Denticeps clupeoides]